VQVERSGYDDDGMTMRDVGISGRSSDLDWDRSLSSSHNIPFLPRNNQKVVSKEVHSIIRDISTGATGAASLVKVHTLLARLSILKGKMDNNLADVSRTPPLPTNYNSIRLILFYP
jgi:hypothetical protein